MRYILRFFMMLLLIAFVGGIIFYFIAGFHFSEGNRTGLLRKFSHKGYLFKTYEGEMFTTCKNIVASPDNTFIFSAAKSHQSAIDSLNAWSGRCITIHYQQVVYNFPW